MRKARSIACRSSAGFQLGSMITTLCGAGQAGQELSLKLRVLS